MRTAAIAANDDELVPAEFDKRLIASESPLRVYRELHGLTQTTLALVPNVNRVQIVEIEGGNKCGSGETLRKLADALNIKIDDLI